MSAIESVVAALYLRGLPRPVEPHARGWPAVLSLLRKANPATPSQAADALRGGGFATEAASLESRPLEHAARLTEAELALTVASPHYPRAWVEKLGAAAPPALYVRGDASLLARPPVAVVGSRHPPARCFREAAAVAEAASHLGHAVASGGAPGIDRAVVAAVAVIEIWPCGLGMRWGARGLDASSVLHLSLWPPREPFSTAGAMERNALVYALAAGAFVGHARFRQGGSWHGATDALRRRLTRVLVPAALWPKPDRPAQRALLGLGAVELACADSDALEAALRAPSLQPFLPVPGLDAPAVGALAAY